ncbi:phage tail tape measure protein [Streptomyces sp. SCSIO ZS0520]|uniref:phage tail tape measure protein n=1 Tax=Streptomyces sp. SCSIO ZS0520 TaxID=2892996 RepID=UPI0021DA8E2E|nr:phage tail tape measure protein [Streptomyces sp. SCSIO ZS0520]
MPRAGAVWVDVLPNMSGFGRALREQIGEPVAQASRQAGEAGGDGLMQGMATKMKAGALAAGAVVGGLVAKGISEAIDKQAATGKLKGQLGLSAKEAKAAGAAAGKLYAGAVTETVEDGAAAVRAVMAAGIAPEKATTRQLTAIATKAQDLSTLFEVDLGQAANAAGQAVKTGLAKNADEALDTMFRGFQVMGPRADDLMDTFNEYSTVFRSLGLDVKTVTGLFSQGMRAGARDTDVVADALKEFQIRTTDGSKASADAFKLLGLNAEKSTAQFARGGKGAARGLQDVLDRLRTMKDPVDRNAAAVGLFGTKAEDLAGALFALDPAAAVADLGKVGGAATRAGDDLRDNAGVTFEQFKRRALMALGQAATKYVIPPLLSVARVLDEKVVPPARSAASWLSDRLGPAFTTVGEATGSTLGWLRNYGAWLAPLGVLVGGLTLMLSANALATGATTAAFSLYRGAILAWAAVQRTAIAVQAAWNAVLALNPIGLIVIGLIALGAALFVAWKKSETFRSVVMGVWSAIQTGAVWLWTNGIRPLVSGFMTGLRAVGAAASWLWSTVLQPTFAAVSTGARILATVLTIVVFGPIYLAVRALGAVFTWLWSAAVRPVLGWISAAAVTMWAVGVRPVLSALMTTVRAVGGVLRWLWNAAARPVFGWITAGARAMGAAAMSTLSALGAALRLSGAAFRWLWKNAVQPALSGIRSAVSSAYRVGIAPVFAALRTATGRVADSFETARRGIKKAWDKVEGIAKKPVAFVIDTVYNRGIVKVWNKVADKFGAPTMSEMKGFARGGVLPGQSSYRQGDDQLVPMRRGEGVAVSEAMRDPYERARLLAVNKAAMQGRSLRQFQGEGFAKGGIFGWVGKAASKGLDLAKAGVGWLKDGMKASAEAGVNAVVRPLIAKISGSASLYRDMITRIPKKMISALFDYSGKADKKLEAAGIGGKGFKAGLSWARTQAGKAYQWGGNGDPSWDCSGFVSAIESVIRGQKPHRRWATGAFSGATAPGGWVLNKRSPYMIGITNAGVGHTAGTINGTNVESRGGDGVVVGSRARGYKDSLFTHRYGFVAKGYAEGGKPRPGEVAWVGERGPELVRFSGGEEVYNHADSLRMWEGLGARGFAKGTKAARSAARKDLPGDLNAFTKSLTGSASDISRAAKELTKDLKAAGVGGKSLTASVTKASTRLQAMAKQRDAVSAKIDTARAAAADQKKTAADYIGLANLADAASIGEVVAGMRARQNTARGFQQQIAALSKKGLSRDLIGQLAALGPESGLAGMVASASGSQIKQLNALAKSGAKLSTGYGNTMADAMYDAGTSASRGFLAGLLAEEAAIQKAMAKIGAGAVKAIRSKKGIDAHSPSRKGEQAGRDVGAGLVAGMTASGADVESAAARLGQSALPSAASRSAGDRDSSLDGRPLYLVVEDGTVLRAYVDDRVDGALSDVRRSKRAGSR